MTTRVMHWDMGISRFPLFFVLSVLMLAAMVSMNAQAQEPIPRGDRLLGLAIMETKHQTYDQALAASIAVGSDYVELVIGWDDVETAPGIHQPKPDFAKIGNAIFPSLGVGVALSFLTLDTAGDRRPVWHQQAAWDDPAVIDAAWSALSRTLNRLNDTALISLSLGNEVDIMLTAAPDQQPSYVVFIRELKQRLKTTYPTLPVGVKVTAGGALASGGATPGQPAIARQVITGMELAMITYYPLDDDFKALPMEAAIKGLDRLVALFPNQPIHMAEIGYPSDPACGGGPKAQGDFIEQVFQAWDRHHERITAMNWVWQTDIGPRDARSMAQAYGQNASCFAGFLGSLGLRSHDLTPKPAWSIFQAASAARDFSR
ncbi:MAG: hypothetical protein AAF213_00840 [Pseudomonadota bacterium]